MYDVRVPFIVGCISWDFLRAAAVALAGAAATAIVISAAVTTRSRAELGSSKGAFTVSFPPVAACISAGAATFDG